MTYKTWIAGAFALVMGCGSTAETDDPDVDAAIDGSQTAGVGIIEIGTVSNGAPVVISIPEHALGFQLVVEVDGSLGNENVGVETVTSPSGEKVLDGFIPVGHVAPIGASTVGIAAISVPQTSSTSAMPVKPGAWTAVFSVPAGRTAHARAYVRTTSDGQFHGGTLDLRLYIPDGLMIGDPMPAHAITASSALEDPCVIARLDTFFATLDSLYDLQRGHVEAVALPGQYVQISDDPTRIAALKETSSSSTGHGVQLIWTNELVLFGTQVWGNSAGLPGTAMTVGHPLSAVVVDVSLGFPAAADGMTMVHEIGHFMGLFHSTEQNRSYHDTLSDTPECVGGSPTCPDDHNIMFPTFYGTSGGVGLTASDQQRHVIWGSPLYTAQ